MGLDDTPLPPRITYSPTKKKSHEAKTQIKILGWIYLDINLKLDK